MLFRSFKDVVFSYPGSENNAVDGISFKINEGETVALVGVSGSGKTTIARLAARFWDVKSGEVLLGGINIKKLSKRELMDNISFVFQNTRLFKGTIKENIMFGSDSVSENDLENAMAQAAHQPLYWILLPTRRQIGRASCRERV